MHKVLVTGGGGFIGKGIVRALLSRGCQVTVVGRNPYPDLTQLGVRCLQGDIQDQSFLLQAFSGMDTVFHVAAKAGIWGSKASYFGINVNGTKNVIGACLHNNISVLVYTSTPSVVFDRAPINGGNEQLAYAKRPLCHYAASKIAAEKMVLQANDETLRTTAIRPHLVWGPGDRQLVPRLVERGRQAQLKIVGDGVNKVDISYIDNVVHAHILAAENLHNEATAAGEAFFIGQQEPVELWDWINVLFAQLGVPKVEQRVAFPVAYLAGAVLEAGYTILGKNEEPGMTRFLAHQLAHSHWFAHTKAEQILRYKEQVNTTQGVANLVAWIKEQHL
ncbi:MAG: 3-beta hydroxysteroid dehydrogenase [Desulfobulbus propionicus]|nr:MAG: 3-beta hydroxysteroid dehydrogenase [Desulfobulbus propionicus]